MSDLSAHSRLKTVVVLVAGALVLLFSMAYTPSHPTEKGHYEHDLKILLPGTNLPDEDNDVFIGSGKCGGCHGVDLAEVPIANLTSEGIHVSPTEDWRATMMANSAKDPFWRAKVAHEVTVNPQHEQALVNKCTSCHSPVGRFTALHYGQENYSMAELEEDSLALDGVNCGACHQQRMKNIGNRFSGELSFHTDTVWGPYISEDLEFPIFSQAMTSFVGYEPVGHPKVAQSEFCAGCHTLLTNSVNLDGQLTGTQFVEQATYHEWLNSSYNEDENLAQECQGCHMPRLDEPIIIASGYSFLPGREPFGQHWLAGGNVFMLELMQNRITELGITATEQHFDKVIERSLNLLQNETAEISISTGEIDGDTARYTVKISNLAGHKFPSGYPARRAFVELVMTNSDGNEIFHSGAAGSQYEVIGQDPVYEPHHNLITSEDQVQIYEMVMGDVNGNVTTILERAYSTIKDNRLVPLGFRTNHEVYDTVSIVGAAALDPDFNHFNGMEGSGTDEIHFHIPVEGVNGAVTVTATLWYQSAPPKWNQELFAVDHPVINAFEEMYLQEGADPIEVASASETSVLVGLKTPSGGLYIGPNPTSDGRVRIQSTDEMIREISVYSGSGQLLERIAFNKSSGEIVLPAAQGSYLIKMTTGRRTLVRKVLRH